MLTSFLSTRIWQVSLPALTKKDLSDHGSCSWISFVQRWMSMMMKFSPSIQENPTILVTSSKDAPFVVLMSLGRLSSNTFQIWSSQHWTCRPLPWANDVSAKVEEAPWVALSHRLFASWSFPSVSKFGPVPSAKSFQTTICSFDTSDMLTIVWSSVTSASQNWHPMKFSSTTASTENPSSSRQNLTRNFLGLCSKQNLWSWFIQDQPIFLKFFHPFLLPLQLSFWVVSAHAATSSSRVLSQLFVFNKVWPN